MKDIAHLEPVEYFRIIWNHRWYFLLTAVLVISGTVTYALWMPNVYKSESRIMVDEPQVSEDYVRPMIRLTPEDRISSIREQLASRTFLERMIEQYQMYGYGRPDFVMESAVKSAQKQIGIEKTSNNTFSISFVSSDPQFSQTVTRQFAQELIRISTSSIKDRVLTTNQFVDEQLRQNTEALTAQGEKIGRFKKAHLGELPEQGNANMSALTGLHSQLTAVENATQQAQERQKLLDFKIQERKRMNLLSQSITPADNTPKTIENKVNKPSSLELELAAKKSQKAQLLTTYTPGHPDVIALQQYINRLEQQLQDQKSASGNDLTPIGDRPAEDLRKGKTADQGDPMEAAFQLEADSIKSEIARREKEKQEILKQIKTYQSRLSLAPALEQELAALLRDEEVLKTQNSNLQKQKFNIQMATTAQTDKKNETYRIIDEANLPVKAEYPNRVQIILMGIAGGLLLGIGISFSRELLDTTISSEAEAKKLLNLPVLVTIPLVPNEKKDKKIA
jgi:polysaccharide chain length determinant protein (PEP-CTERM system associated)